MQMEVFVQKYHQAEEDRLAKKHQKHWDTCSFLFDQMLSLCIKEVHQKDALEGANVSAKETAEWMTLFANWQPIIGDEVIEAETNVKELSQIDESTLQMLDQSDLQQYLRFCGEWDLHWYVALFIYLK